MPTDKTIAKSELTITPTLIDGMYEMIRSRQEAAVYYSKSLLDKGIVIFDDVIIDKRNFKFSYSELLLLRLTSNGDKKCIHTYLLERKSDDQFFRLYIDLILEKLDRLLRVNDEAKIKRVLQYLGQEHSTYIEGEGNEQDHESFDTYFKQSFAWLKNDVFNIYPDNEVDYEIED